MSGVLTREILREAVKRLSEVDISPRCDHHVVKIVYQDSDWTEFLCANCGFRGWTMEKISG